MRYIIVGAGGIGGALGAYLCAAGQDVALIARGEHLRAIQQNGLTFDSVLKGKLNLAIEAHEAGDDFAPADIVLVCVKGYSLTQAAPVIKKAAKKDALVIPILNSLQAGKRLQQALPELTVLDGCIYTSAFIEAPGVIKQPANFMRIVCGARQGQLADQAKLERLAVELSACGVATRISPYIEGDMFTKFAFISTFAGADSYFDVTAAELQQEGPPRQMMASLLQELIALGRAQGVAMEGDLFADTLALLDKTAPGITTSMHKDVAAGRDFEKQELIFDVVEMAAALGVDVPTYRKVAEHFGYQK